MRFNPFVSLLAASLIALLPAHAMAQTAPTPTTPTQPSAQEPPPPPVSGSVRDRERSEYDPLGMRLGGFNLNAALDFGIATTDNLFAAEDATAAHVDDRIFTVNPTARLASDWSRHSVEVDAASIVTRHEDFTGEDSDQWSLRMRGRLDVTDQTRVGASVRFADEVKPRTDPDSPTVGNPVEYTRTDYGVYGEHQFARVLARVDAGHVRYDYDGAQSFLDNEEDTYRGRLAFELSPSLSVVGQATYDEREYKNTPAYNSEGQAYLAGVALDRDIYKGEILIGWFDRDYELAWADGVAVQASLEWYPSSLTTVTLTARRDADDQISTDFGFPYITEQVGARVDHELRRNVILMGSVAGGNREYAIDREDEFIKAEFGADYLLNRRVAVRGRYQYNQSDSSGFDAGRDFDASTFRLGLSLRL